MADFDVDLLKQFSNEFKGRGPMKVQSFLDSKYDEFRVNELKKYLHLMPYIFILIQAILTRKVPTRIQEIRLLTLTMFFHATEIKSIAQEISRSGIFSLHYVYWISLQCIGIISFLYLVKLFTLLGIVITARIIIEEKKLASRVQFREYVRSRLNPLDTLIILVNLTIYIFTPSFYHEDYSHEVISFGTVLSIRAAIDLIECGLLFANFRLKGSDIDKNDMIGFGLTILAYANTFDYKPTSICPISFAVYYICIGLYDKLRDRNEVHNEVRVPSVVLEVPKMNETVETVEVENVGQKTVEDGANQKAVGEIIKDGIVSDVRVVGEDQTVVESQVVGIGDSDIRAKQLIYLQTGKWPGQEHLK